MFRASRWQFGLVMALLFAGSQPLLAEIVYVDDIVRLGVRSNQDNRSRPLAIVVTGTALEVLKKDKSYYKIRTPKGSVGWVLKTYVTNDKPAKLRLVNLQEQFDAINEQLREFQARTSETEDQNTLLADKLAEATRDRNALAKQMAILHKQSGADRRARQSRWTYMGGGLLAMFLLSFILGALWYRQRAMKRLGGLSI